MSQRNRLLVGLLLGLIVVAGVIYAVDWLRRDGAEIPTGSDGSDGTPPTAQVSGVLVVRRQGGVRQWQLRVEEMRELDGRVELEGVYDGVLYSDGKEMVYFSAERGVYDTATGNLQLAGTVRVSRGDEPLLVTERLDWEAATERVTTGPVEIWHEGIHIRAGGLDGDLSEGTLWLTENVQLEMRDGSIFRASRFVEYHLEKGIQRAGGSIGIYPPDNRDE